MQLLQSACREKLKERRGIRDTILPEQEHAWNTGVVVKKRLRQGSKGVISETVLRQVKSVQPNVHAGVLRAELANDLRQSIAHIGNILDRHESSAGHIDRDACRSAAAGNSHAIRIHGGRVGRREIGKANLAQEASCDDNSR